MKTRHGVCGESSAVSAEAVQNFRATSSILSPTTQTAVSRPSTLRTLADANAARSLFSFDLRVWAARHAVLLRKNVVIVETRPEQEIAWVNLIRSIAPDAAFLLGSVKGGEA